MAVKSGIPTTVNGVQVGATDFSEFEVGAGLPAGITGLSANFPANVAINDAPVSPSFTDEGKYLEMLPVFLFNEPWAFVIDAFDGIMEQGELLARVSSNFSSTQNRNCMGPGMSLRLNPGIFGAASKFHDAFSSGEVEVSGAVFINGGTGSVAYFPISQALQEDDWIWLRIRKTNNVADPNDDDWQVTAWYGDIEDEPASVDGTVIAASLTAPRGLFGIGCTYISPGSTFIQRCAFLSYSENPDVEPPPVPPLGAATVWTPFPRVFAPGLPKPVTIARPVVEFDVRQVRDDPQYNDGDSLVVSSGGVGWKDLEVSDQQGRTDANFNTSGNVLFVKEGWTPGIDAVRFVGFPVGAPTNPLGSRLPWIGGGINGSDWVGNNYTIFGVMRATDISQRAALIGGTAGLVPIFPKKTLIWVEPDGSVVCHHTAEENVATIQPGSFYSVQSAPGVVQPGDDLIISLTASANFGDRQGKILRVNGVEVARNSNAFATFNQEFIAPTIGAGGTQATSVGSVDSVGGLDRLIVYLAGFGSLATLAEVEAYESFLAGAFQLDFRTQWTDVPAVSPGTVWANTP
jgi:hypothetical protein